MILFVMNCTKTLQLRIKDKHAKVPCAMAREVNQVWNHINAVSAKAARPLHGKPPFLSGYDLQKITADHSTCDGVSVGSGAVQWVSVEYATRRRMWHGTRSRHQRRQKHSRGATSPSGSRNHRLFAAVRMSMRHCVGGTGCGGREPDRLVDRGCGGAQPDAGDQPPARSLHGRLMLVTGPARAAGKLGALLQAPHVFCCFVAASSRLVIAPCVALLLSATAAAPFDAMARDKPTPQVYEAQVTHVSDGDSVWVQPLAGGRYRKLRLVGLDAPEICQLGGTQARDALTQRVLKQRVTVTESARDTYGRGLAKLEHQGQDVGGWLVAEGQAWSSRWHSSLGPYQAQEARARAQRRGLFAQANAELPRTFRQRHGPCERTAYSGR